MTARLGDTDVRLLGGRNFAHFVTLNADGSPQVTPVWVDTDGEHVLVNTSVGRVKDRNVRRDPRVAVSIHAQDDPYTWVSVRGTVVEMATEGALEHIDFLNRKYHDGEPWEVVPEQQRVIYRIRPVRIARSS